MKKILWAGLAGGLVVFLWGFVSHMLLPLGEMGFTQMPVNSPLLEAMKQNLKDDGLYAFPGLEVGCRQTEAEDAVWVGKYKMGPNGLLLTHAHFDHIGGAGAIAHALNPLPLVALHANDHVLWRAGGDGSLFGFDIDPGPEPTIDFVHGMKLRLGSTAFEVRFTPGHTTGHCILYVPSADVCFCGELIFAGSVGRTDVPGGNWETLVKSIREQIYTLPDNTRLLSGHGPETTVGEEKVNNPFVSEG